MDHVVLVRIFKSLRNRADILERGVYPAAIAAPLPDAVKRLGACVALDVLRRDVAGVLPLPEPVNLDNVRMVELRRQLGLVLESLRRIWCNRQHARKHLERDIPIEIDFFSQVHDAHSAQAKSPDDLKAINHRWLDRGKIGQ